MDLENSCDNLLCPGLSNLPRYSDGSARRGIENLPNVIIRILMQEAPNVLSCIVKNDTDELNDIMTAT